MMFGKKKLSGAENLKRKLERQKSDVQDAGRMAKFLKQQIQPQNASDNSNSSKASTSEMPGPGTSEQPLEETSEECSKSSEKADLPIDDDDISKWPMKLPRTVVDDIVMKGPKTQCLDTQLTQYPKNDEGRHFSSAHYWQKMPNNETYRRRWLVYSQSVDKVFCFCCKLFSNSTKQYSLSNDGTDDWRHLSVRLKNHEVTLNHLKAMSEWTELEQRLKSQTGIDKEILDQILTEKERWRKVFERLIAITVFLAEHNLAFRGSSAKLFTPNNGNFLGLVQLIAKFDPILEEHTRRVKDEETNIHYCGPRIQNELISLIGKGIRSTILEKVNRSKYFSIILDCTPDISHTEQMSLTLRLVDLDDVHDGVSVREFFITYWAIEDSTGLGLTTTVLDNILNQLKLDMNDCRGQGYDNGANMAGKHQGVQAWIVKKYPRAFFNPCGCHSLNLVVADGAKSSVKSISLFGVIQRIFVLFSASTKRWAGVSECVKGLTLKKVCETRWESRVSSLKSIRFQYKEVCEALGSLQDEATDPVVSSEAESLLRSLEDFEFIVTLVVWFDILSQVNVVSKAMQSETSDLESATSLLRSCVEYISDYRETGYQSSIETATEIAKTLDVQPVFQEKRLRRVRKQFDYEGRDEAPTDPETIYKTGVFYPMIDNIKSSLDTRFEQLQDHADTWSFLFNIKRAASDKETLMKCCKDLHVKLTDGDESDINGIDLFEEIIRIQPFLKDSDRPIEVLRLMKKNNWQEMWPNLWISLRILLTIVVSVASGERSFSKLKLIKTYLRSTMGDERLSDLAIVSIENELAHQIDYSEVTDTFAMAKSRKAFLK